MFHQLRASQVPTIHCGTYQLVHVQPELVVYTAGMPSRNDSLAKAATWYCDTGDLKNTTNLLKQRRFNSRNLISSAAGRNPEFIVVSIRRCFRSRHNRMEFYSSGDAIMVWERCCQFTLFLSAASRAFVSYRSISSSSVSGSGAPGSKGPGIHVRPDSFSRNHRAASDGVRVLARECNLTIFTLASFN